MAVNDRFRTSWKLFKDAWSPRPEINYNLNAGSSHPRHRAVSYKYNTSNLSKTVFNRIATDAAMVSINHVKTDGTTTDVVKDSKLQYCLSVEANIDQTAFQFLHDVIYSCMDEGVVAIVPTEANWEPNDTGAFDIYAMRVGRILEWFPAHVRVRLYNDVTGEEEDFTLSKRQVAIIENPFYEVVNSSSSSLERLKRKMRALDSLDEDVLSNKFNLIFQLPYEVRGALRTEKARTRVKDIEDQLKNNQYGIAYTGTNEKVIQLNRPIDNDLVEQVQYLREEFFNQLGLTDNIFNGTASEAEMNNYYARAIDPFLTVIIQEFRRKFLTQTARTKGHDIAYNRDLFKLIPVSTLAEIADKMSRNEILSPNEIRGVMGFRSSSDPKANELLNRNIALNNQLPGEEPPRTEEQV